MPGSKTLVLTGILAATLLSIPTADAEPFFRVRVRGANPDTGNAGSASATYNPATGNRTVRARSVDTTTGTYTGTTRYFNRITGQGGTTSTSITRGSGATTTVNTLENGSFECSISQDLPANCVQFEY